MADRKSLKSLKTKSQTLKVLKEFCESTSLHGYNYFHIFNSKWLSAIWMLVVFAMNVLGIVFLSWSTEEYMEAQMVTNIETSTASLKVN